MHPFPGGKILMGLVEFQVVHALKATLDLGRSRGIRHARARTSAAAWQRTIDALPSYSLFDMQARLLHAAFIARSSVPHSRPSPVRINCAANRRDPDSLQRPPNPAHNRSPSFPRPTPRSPAELRRNTKGIRRSPNCCCRMARTSQMQRRRGIELVQQVEDFNPVGGDGNQHFEQSQAGHRTHIREEGTKTVGRSGSRRLIHLRLAVATSTRMRLAPRPSCNSSARKGSC